MHQCSIAEIPAQTRTFDWRLGVRTAPEKPRHVLIAFQSDRSGNQDKNPSLFDHLSATEVSVVLNDTNYPALLILRSTDMCSTTKCLPSLLETIMGWILL